MRAILNALFIALCIPTATAQNMIIQDERIHKVQRLAGTIYAGETELPGGLLPGASVEVCQVSWKHCSEAAIANLKGRFTIPSKHKQGLYYLRISYENCNPLLIKVRLSPLGPKSLKISLTVAT